MSESKNHDNDIIHPVARHFLWLASPWARKMPLYIFFVLSVVLLVLEFFYPRHGYKAFEESWAFYTAMGFFGFCFAVLAGWPLRKLLARRPDYYEAPNPLGLKQESHTHD